MKAPVTISQLKQRVKFEKNVQVITDTGGSVDSFTEFLTTYGYLKKNGGSRSLEAMDDRLSSSYTCYVRFQESLDNEINTNIRLVINNRFFYLESYEEVEFQNRFFKLQLRESE